MQNVENLLWIKNDRNMVEFSSTIQAWERAILTRICGNALVSRWEFAIFSKPQIWSEIKQFKNICFANIQLRFFLSIYFFSDNIFLWFLIAKRG